MPWWPVTTRGSDQWPSTSSTRMVKEYVAASSQSTPSALASQAPEHRPSPPQTRLYTATSSPSREATTPSSTMDSTVSAPWTSRKVTAAAQEVPS